MQQIVKLVDKGPTSNKHDDDLSDRLNSRYTVLILVVFCIVVTSQLYIGKPITCWAPKEFSGGWIKFMNNYCWVKNTYYLPLEDRIPLAPSGDRENREILYYQWLPFILLLQALFFYLPSVVWHAFNQKAGVDCDSILSTANKFQNTQKEDGRKRLLRLITNQMDRFILARAEDQGGEMKVRNIISKTCCCVCNLMHGKYLVILYMFSKLLYMLNVIAQFFLLNMLLRSEYSLYGYELVQNIMYDRHYVNSATFPRVTMCDFSVRRLGNVHRYTVQCVLPINMYVEKIYAFLWVWMLFIAVVSSAGFIQWLMRIMLAQDKYRYIRGHMRTNELLDNKVQYQDYKHDVAKFVDTYLNQDGVFILRLIGHNTNNMTVTEVLKSLFENWQLKRNKKTDYPSLEDVDPAVNLGEKARPS